LFEFEKLEQFEYSAQPSPSDEGRARNCSGGKAPLMRGVELRRTMPAKRPETTNART